jgi:hypothetical protein
MRPSSSSCVLRSKLIAAIAYPTLSAVVQQPPAPKTGGHRVIAHYFHTNTRCSTCIKIEQFSKEAIEQGFPEELKNGALELRIVNYENPTVVLNAFILDADSDKRRFIGKGDE